jgi:bifunctional DNA-binding transcriptional regulator/antitoxin component of YhaV-PrlF toxin-antitoxin module
MTDVNNSTYEVITQVDPVTGEIILPIPPEVLHAMGWKEGDEIDFTLDSQGRLVMVRRGALK